MVFLLMSLFAVSQGELYVFGVVKDYNSGEKLENITITVTAGGEQIDQITTKGNGKYEFFLPLGKLYIIRYNRDDLVAKKVQLDSREIPEQDAMAGFSMNIEMTLFENMEGLDTSLLDEPIGKAKFDPEKSTMEFDFEYTRQIQSKIKDMMKKVEERNEEQQELQEEFNKLMEDGKENLADGDFEDAVGNFQSAVDLKPQNQEAKDKLAEAQEKLDEKLAEQQAEEEYSNLLDEADSFFRTEDFEQAIEKYNAALEIKPEESYPQEQITAAEKKLEELAAQKERNEEYNALVKEGNELMDSEDYEGAIARYDEALLVKPLGEEAEDKKEEAQELLEQKQAREQKQAQYDELIASADELFEQEKFSEAIAKYEEALGVFSDEQYPQDQIAKAESKIAKKEAQAEYEQVIADADKLFEEESYEQAIAKYEEASEMLPDEQYPKDRISEAQTLLDEMRAEQQKEEQFTALMQEGDDAMSDENYETAVSKFEEALGIKPENEDAIAKKQAAQEALDAQQAKQAANKEYNELVAEADGYFEQGNLEEAKKKYQAALDVKSDEQYPSDQIEEIDRQLAERAAKEEEYSQFMEAGNTAMEEENYKLAVEKYEAALGVKPEDEEAQTKRDEANQLRQQALKQEEVQAEYDNTITEADAARDEERFEDAIGLYEDAQSLKPDESYPQEQITAIEEIIAKRERKAEEEKQQRFDNLVAEGDALGEEEKFDDAIAKYEEALEVIPESPGVQEKIEQMKQLKEEKLAAMNRQEQFDELVAQAETKADDGDLEGAIGLYEQAVELISDNEQANSRLEELQAELEAERQAEKQKQFDDLVAQGELAEEQERFQEAVSKYEDALEIFPEDEDIQGRIDRLNEKITQLEEKEELEAKYSRLISEAQEKADEQEYQMAISKMQEAAELKPDETYPPERIEEWTKLKEELEAKRAREKAEQERLAREKAKRERLKNKEENYTAAIETGDKKFEERKYDEAISAYEEALELKPEKYYPKSMIEKVNMVKKKREEANQKQQELTAQRDQEKKEDESKSRNYKRVRGNSEDEAEKFMREARQADKKQKYEEIKEQKKNRQERQENYTEAAAETRKDAHEDAEQLRKPLSERFSGQYALQDKRAEDMMKYKQTLEERSGEASEKHMEEVRSNNERLNELEKERSKQQTNRQEAAQESGKEYHEKVQKHDKQRAEWQQEDLDELREAGEEFTNKRESIQTQNRKAIEKRDERAQETVEYRKEWEEYSERKAQESYERNKDQQEQINKKKSRLEAEQLEQNGRVDENYEDVEEQKRQTEGNRRAASQLADARRDIARTEAQQKESKSGPKEFDEYQRSQLAEQYPQGVTEESTTMGNKVIIRRIVVRGNKGDEYKKVVDKSGNYYFKNGQSITEQTWYRETVEEFE